MPRAVSLVWYLPPTALMSSLPLCSSSNSTHSSTLFSSTALNQSWYNSLLAAACAQTAQQSKRSAASLRAKRDETNQNKSKALKKTSTRQQTINRSLTSASALAFV